MNTKRLMNVAVLLLIGLATAGVFRPLVVATWDYFSWDLVCYLVFWLSPAVIFSGILGLFLLCTRQSVTVFTRNHWVWLLFALAVAHIPLLFISWAWLTLNGI